MPNLKNLDCNINSRLKKLDKLLSIIFLVNSISLKVTNFNYNLHIVR